MRPRVAFALVLLVGGLACDGSVILSPRDNTRLTTAQLGSPSGGAPFTIRFLLNEDQHERLQAVGNDWPNIFRLEGYGDLQGRWKSALRAGPRRAWFTLDLSETSPYIDGPSYLYTVTIDLYDLGIHREPGSYGASFKFRMFLKDGDGVWQRLPGLTVSPTDCLARMNRGDQQCPHTFEVRLRTPGYVPDLTRGRTDCAYGEEDCSMCVPDIAQQVRGLGFHRNYVMDVGNSGRNRDHHIQGVARLSDGRSADGRVFGRLVATQNVTGAGFEVGFHRADGGLREGWRDRSHEFDAAPRVDVRDVLNHPGGVQAHGDLVAVALEQQGGSTPPAAVYFVRVARNPDADPSGEIVNRLVLDGSQGEPFQRGQSSAATAGFVQLASGHQLLAVSGASHGTQGIWFYESVGTEPIGPSTSWNFVAFWNPNRSGNCIGKGGDCLYGAGGGLNLHTGCDGQVYLLAMHGSQGAASRDDSVLQLFALLQDATGAVRLDKRAVWERTFPSAIANNSFRWAGGSYVSRDGALVILDTRRRNGPLGGIGGVIARKLKVIEINQYAHPGY